MITSNQLPFSCKTIPKASEKYEERVPIKIYIIRSHRASLASLAPTETPYMAYRNIGAHPVNMSKFLSAPHGQSLALLPTHTLYTAPLLP
jgi:hypothetical protein